MYATLLSCDLLSNFFQTIFDNNWAGLLPFRASVVICFQTFFKRSLITTGGIFGMPEKLL